MSDRLVRPTRGWRLAALSLLLSHAPTLAAQVPVAPPAPMALKPAVLPPFQEVTLANGLRVLLVENHRNPAVVFRLVMPAGNVYDAADKAGTASLTAGLLTKGAGSRTADQLAAAIENAGGNLVAVSDDDYLSVFGSVLSNATPLAFELLGDVVTRPAFSEQEFELARTQTLSGLQLNSASPAFLAAKAFRTGLYGAHPYGVIATPTTVRAITRADVQQFHAARIRPRGALLVVAGDLTMAQLTALAAKAFSGWTGAAASATTRPAPPTRSATEIVLVHRPGSVQSNVLVGNLALSPADPARLAAELAIQVVGGGSDGRLFKTLREQKSWTYGAYATLTRPRGIGRFEANAEVRTEVTDSAVVEMLAQLTRLGAENIPAKELDDVRGGMVGSFPLAIETPNGLAALVAFMKLYGLPANYLQTYRPRMAALTAAQVRLAAARAVRPTQALIVVVGDGAKLYDRLAKIAPVTMRNADGDVLQPSDLVPKSSAMAFDASQLKAMRDSFVITMRGQVFGRVVTTVEPKNDGWAYEESSIIADGAVRLHARVETDRQLSPRSIKSQGVLQKEEIVTDLTFVNGRAKGMAQSATPSGPQTRQVDMDVPAGTLASDVVRLSVPLFRWKEKASYTMNVFSPATGAVQPVTLTAAGSETVTVPAGTFECWRVEQTGGYAPATYYLAKGENRIVQIGTPGQPLLIQLTK